MDADHSYDAHCNLTRNHHNNIEIYSDRESDKKNSPRNLIRITNLWPWSKHGEVFKCRNRLSGTAFVTENKLCNGARVASMWYMQRSIFDFWGAYTGNFIFERRYICVCVKIRNENRNLLSHRDNPPQKKGKKVYQKKKKEIVIINK